MLRVLEFHPGVAFVSRKNHHAGIAEKKPASLGTYLSPNASSEAKNAGFQTNRHNRQGVKMTTKRPKGVGSSKTATQRPVLNQPDFVPNKLLTLPKGTAALLLRVETKSASRPYFGPDEGARAEHRVGESQNDQQRHKQEPPYELRPAE